MSETVPQRVGKNLKDLYDAMRSEYGKAGDRTEGSRRALDIYAANRVYLEDLKILIADIEDFARLLTDALRAQEEARAKEERSRSRSFRSGCTVVKLVPCGKQCSGCPHGPYAYWVWKEGGRQIWKYLGRA